MHSQFVDLEIENMNFINNQEQNRSLPISTRMAEVEWREGWVRDGGSRRHDSRSGSLHGHQCEHVHSSWPSYTERGTLQNEGGHSQDGTSRWQELRNIQLAVSSHRDKTEHTRQKIKSTEREQSYAAADCGAAHEGRLHTDSLSDPSLPVTIRWPHLGTHTWGE